MKKLSILFAIALFMFTSCEEFLTKNPLDQVATDEAITTISDAEVALNGVYSSFKSTSYYGRYYVAHADVLTDELQSVIGYSNQLGEFYKWSFLSDNGEVTGAWNIMYKTIIRASNVIDALPAIEDADEDDLSRIEAEARLARAIAHFDLVRAFAKAYTQANPATDLGVPIIEHFELNAPERNTLDEVYTFIIDEAKTAKTVLASSGRNEKASVFLTEGTAAAFLARVSLYMGEWNDAISYATEVIDNPLYTLSNDSASIAKTFRSDDSDEVIFKIGLTKGDYDGRYIGYNYYNNSQGAPNCDYVPAQWILDLFGANDLRYDITFKSEENKFGWTWPLVWKYPGNPAFYDFANNDLTTNANMYKVFRLSEMYLIRAEANAEIGGANEAIALTDYNLLRSNRITGYSNETYTGQALKNAIWDERVRELCFEGHHFFDLKRKGLGFTRVPIVHPDEGAVTNPGPNQSEMVIEPDNARWLWPIPDNEIRANENITPNPGY